MRGKGDDELIEREAAGDIEGGGKGRNGKSGALGFRFVEGFNARRLAGDRVGIDFVREAAGGKGGRGVHELEMKVRCHGVA
jgi:hypothetical protein